MQKPTLSSVANRTGRIAIASLLTGVFATIVAVLEDPSLVDMNGFEIFAGLFSALMQLSVYTTLYSIGVILVMLTFWGLSPKFGRKRAWIGINVVGVLFVILYSLDLAETEPLALATKIVLSLAKLSAILSGVAIVEVLFQYDISDDFSFTDVSTAYGSVLLVFIVTISLVAAGTGVVGAVATSTDLLDTRSGVEHVGMPADEFRAQFGHVTEAETGDDLVCSGGEGSDRDPIVPVAETHENDLSEWDVNASIEEQVSLGTRHLELNLDLVHTGDEELYQKRIIRTNEDPDSWSRESTHQIRDDSAWIELTETREAADQEEPVDGTSIELYTLTQDGEVHRYTANLCDDNLE